MKGKHFLIGLVLIMTFNFVACGGDDNSCTHEWDVGVVTTPATETTDGVKTFTCNKCSTTKTEVIPATGTSSPIVGYWKWTSAENIDLYTIIVFEADGTGQLILMTSEDGVIYEEHPPVIFTYEIVNDKLLISSEDLEQNEWKFELSEDTNNLTIMDADILSGTYTRQNGS